MCVHTCTISVYTRVCNQCVYTRVQPVSVQCVQCLYTCMQVVSVHVCDQSLYTHVQSVPVHVCATSVRTCVQSVSVRACTICFIQRRACQPHCLTLSIGSCFIAVHVEHLHYLKCFIYFIVRLHQCLLKKPTDRGWIIAVSRLSQTTLGGGTPFPSRHCSAIPLAVLCTVTCCLSAAWGKAERVLV